VDKVPSVPGVCASRVPVSSCSGRGVGRRLRETAPCLKRATLEGLRALAILEIRRASAVLAQAGICGLPRKERLEEPGHVFGNLTGVFVT